MILLKILSALAGLALILSTITSALRTFVVPRALPDPLSRWVAVGWRRLFGLRLKLAKGYVKKDWILAFYAPVTLVSFPIIWLTLITVGFALIFWATGDRSLEEAFYLSGSSVLTLGFASSDAPVERLLIFSAAAVGLILVALLISYLPTMYSAYSAREAAVTLLDVRAGSPPSAIEMLLRLYRIGDLENLGDFWKSWENWFAQLEESHTSLAILAFYRSPVPEYSWVTASGTILDAAALLQAAVDKKKEMREALCLRAGYLALRRIGGFFTIPYKEEVTWEDPISISREEFEEALDALAAGGVPLLADRDQAWRDFRGWRVNYDTVLLALCNITMAPYAPWSSDRARSHSAIKKTPLFYRRKKERG